MVLYAGQYSALYVACKKPLYSCVFYSQGRVALTAATITCKITCYILKSVHY